jgi:predicted RNA methylase
MDAQSILEQRRAQLARLHPLKQEHRERAQELYNKIHEIKAQAETRAEEREITSNHPYDLFVTPPDLARRMVDLAAENTPKVCQWIEPSAGTGNIVKEIYAAGFGCHCVELNYNAAELLRKHYPNVTQGDFLEYQERTDIFVMNPPFSNGQDVDHVLHAYELLNTGGRIVAIMSPHAFFASDKKSVSFRDWFTGTAEDLPAGTFKASGTNVSAKLVIINKSDTTSKLEKVNQ